jgi:hypothetical protein
MQPEVDEIRDALPVKGIEQAVGVPVQRGREKYY